MAKRHESLVQLSREHHEALLLALRLQQGTRALLRLWSHDPQFQAERVVEFYDRHLQRHFAEEEQVLFPIVSSTIPSARSIIENLVTEHRMMEKAISAFRHSARGVVRDDLVAFGKLLEEHARTEDRTFFPMIEEQATDDVLADIRRKLEQFVQSGHPKA